MLLKDWMKDNEITCAKLARILDFSFPATKRLVDGHYPKIMYVLSQLENITLGKVTFRKLMEEDSANVKGNKKRNNKKNNDDEN